MFDEKFVSTHNGLTVEYVERLTNSRLELRESGDVVWIYAQDLDKFRGYINRLVNSINTKKFLEHSNGAEEAPEDIYGGSSISDSVE